MCAWPRIALNVTMFVSRLKMWMPCKAQDGKTVLQASSLPFSVLGVGDLLALFRCVSVRYRFGTDSDQPHLMGAVGRVYSTMQPESSNNLQRSDKRLYLRVTEAQRCRWVQAIAAGLVTLPITL